MSQVKYGELNSWDDAAVTITNDFMNLKEGTNRIRVVTNPFQFFVAWVKDASGANRKIRSSLKNCPLVKAGYKLQPRWYIGVLDRAAGAPKILEISSQVFSGIKNCIGDPDWGDVKQYDIDIKRGPKGSQPLYTVLPKPKVPLTDEEKGSVKEFLGRVDISKFTQPPTPEEVAEKMGLTEPEPTPAVPKSDSADDAGKVSNDDFDFGDDDL